MNLKQLGKRIQLAREEKKLSQEQLANAIGCSQSALSNYEQGKRRIYLSQLEKLSETLEKPLSYFMDNGETVEGDVPESSMDNNLILRTINNLYRLNQNELKEVDRYIHYLLWKGKERRGYNGSEY